MGSKIIIFVTMSMHVTQRHFIAFWCNFLILAFVSVRSLCLVEEVYDLWSDKKTNMPRKYPAGTTVRCEICMRSSKSLVLYLI